MSKFDWKVLDRNYEDIIYETYNGIAKITINRPEVRNAFRPKTVTEMVATWVTTIFLVSMFSICNA